jgi:hypothetical protein
MACPEHHRSSRWADINPAKTDADRYCNERCDYDNMPPFERQDLDVPKLVRARIAGGSGQQTPLECPDCHLALNQPLKTAKNQINGFHCFEQSYK